MRLERITFHIFFYLHSKSIFKHQKYEIFFDNGSSLRLKPLHGSPKWPKYEKKCLAQTTYFLKRVYLRLSKNSKMPYGITFSKDIVSELGNFGEPCLFSCRFNQNKPQGMTSITKFAIAISILIKFEIAISKKIAIVALRFCRSRSRSIYLLLMRYFS